MAVVMGLMTWLALAPGSVFPLLALASLVDSWLPAGVQAYRADLPHLLGFAGLVVLFTALLGRVWVATVGVLAFSTLLEVIQGWVPWREASWADLRVNLLAVALGLVLVGLWATLRHMARAMRPAAGLWPIVAEFERSFGWCRVRAQVHRARWPRAQVTLWVPDEPSPAMALLARAIEAEWAARGRPLRIRLVATREGARGVGSRGDEY